jgi:predicted ribosome quality control (RQC) complex YloA/Tae2 family protein
VKLYQLRILCEYLQKYKRIKRARRIQNNTIEVDFGDTNSIFFDLTRANSIIYQAPSIRPPQQMNAPFDTLLNSLISQSQIVKISLLGDDRVLSIEVKPKSQYKDKRVTLQLEFTGKHTNAILLDDKGNIIEALRHIDSNKSFRVIQPNVKLLPLPQKRWIEKSVTEKTIDIKEWLDDNYRRYIERVLTRTKKSKLSIITKRRKKILDELQKLPSPEELEQQAKIYQNYGNIILMNLHNIKQYDRVLESYDFEGERVVISLPENVVKSRFSQFYFDKAKKSYARAKSVHIEKKNLEEKLKFYENIIYSIKNSNDPYEIELLVPKQSRLKRKKEKLKWGELYWIEGYKVFVGRNSQENQRLLSIAKSNDVWMHIRGVPSSHLIIRTDKRTLPDTLLHSAAKLCVNLSLKQSGDYEVDYTRRKFVKIKDGSNVEYGKYGTLTVTKEGVEIRF